MGKDLKGRELGIGLTQRKDGRYSAKFTKKNGQRPEKYFEKLRDAKEWIAEQKYLDECLLTGNLKVDEWFNLWIKNYKEDIVKDNTLKNYAVRYRINIKPYIGNYRIDEVRQIHCQKILNDMANEGYSDGSIELTKITLHAIFKDAVNNRYITKNPAEGLTVKRTSGSEERRVLSVNEENVLKEYVQKSMYAEAYLLSLQTGLRVGEIGGLKWDDIDFNEKTLHVQRTLLQDKSKGGFYFGTPKTKTSIRKIPLTDEAIEILNHQKQKQSKLKAKCKSWNDTWDGLVFTTTTGNPVGSSTFRNMLIRIVGNINLDRKIEAEGREYEEFKKISFHSLRHTFATRCIERGVIPKVLQKFLGHANISTTMDLYVHVTEDIMYDEIQKFEGKDKTEAKIYKFTTKKLVKLS